MIVNAPIETIYQTESDERMRKWTWNTINTSVWRGVSPVYFYVSNSFSSYEVISDHQRTVARVSLKGTDTGPSLIVTYQRSLGNPTLVNFWCVIPRIFTEMNHFGKYLRAAHHLNFQTPFLRRINSRLNHKYKSCNIALICKGLLGSSQMSLAKNVVVRQMHFVVWPNLGVPVYSRFHDKNLVITYW